MTEHKSMLCVGGPCAGQRFDAQTHVGFCVPIEVKYSYNDPHSEDFQPNKKIDVADVYYRSETFHTPQGEISFWTPTNQTPIETITTLLETYETKQPGKRLRNAVDYVLSKFKRDEEQGYRSRDRQFAIAILDKAIQTMENET